MSRQRIFTTLFGCALAAITSAPNAAAITCGEVLTGSSNILTADLDCTGHPAPALTLEGRATLDLAGFTLTGGDVETVFCSGNCRLQSTGAEGIITGAGTRAVHGYGSDLDPTVTISDLLITGNTGLNPAVEVENVILERVRILSNAGPGIFARNMRATDCTVSNNGGDGIQAGDFQGPYRLKLENVIAANNGGRGAFGRQVKAKIFDSEFSDNTGKGVEVTSGSAVVINGTFRRNGEHALRVSGIDGTKGKLRVKVGEFADGADAVSGPKKTKLIAVSITGMTPPSSAAVSGSQLTIIDSTISDTAGNAVSASDVRLKRSTIMNSDNAGVIAGATARLAGSTISASSLDAVVCAIEPCADIVVFEDHKVRLNGTSSCETSLDVSTGLSLGICSLD